MLLPLLLHHSPTTKAGFLPAVFSGLVFSLRLPLSNLPSVRLKHLLHVFHCLTDGPSCPFCPQAHSAPCSLHWVKQLLPPLGRRQAWACPPEFPHSMCLPTFTRSTGSEHRTVEWEHKWTVIPISQAWPPPRTTLRRIPGSPGSQSVISCSWKTSPAPPNLPNLPGQPALATRACREAGLNIGMQERQEAPGLPTGGILTHLLSGMRKSRASCSARLLWPPRIRVVTVSCRDRSRNWPPSSSSRRRCSRRSLI